jgi:hypothetical protein
MGNKRHIQTDGQHRQTNRHRRKRQTDRHTHTANADTSNEPKVRKRFHKRANDVQRDVGTVGAQQFHLRLRIRIVHNVTGEEVSTLTEEVVAQERPAWTIGKYHNAEVPVDGDKVRRGFGIRSMHRQE